MRKHGGTPSWRDKHVTPAAISPPRVARGRFVGGQQSGLAGCKPPPLFTRGACSCSSQGRRQGEPRIASPRPSVPTYLPTWREETQLPSLQRMARQYVCVPATSAGVERLFSRASLTYGDLRTCLSEENLSNILFAAYNYDPSLH